MSGSETGNINSNDLDEDTKEKLKGDNIGDTLYSESFVLRTLLKLSDLESNKWCEEFEQDLCFLWDMTLEQEVCKLLFKFNYPSLACTVICHSEQGRLIEIVVGILANIFVSNCEKNITDYELGIIFTVLYSSDSAVLVQVMRLLEAVAYYLPSKIELVKTEEKEQLQQIMKNSKNDLLIKHTLQAIEKMTEDCKLNYSEVDFEFYVSIVTGFDTIFDVNSGNVEEELDKEETNRIVKVFLRIITNISAYAEKYKEVDVNYNISNCISTCSTLLVLISQILKYFSKERYLFPISTYFNEYMESFLIIFSTYKVTIMSDLTTELLSHIFQPLCEILYLLQKFKSEVSDSCHLVKDLIVYIVCSVNSNAILNELRRMNYSRRTAVVNSLKESNKIFDHDISNIIAHLSSLLN